MQYTCLLALEWCRGQSFEKSLWFQDSRNPYPREARPRTKFDGPYYRTERSPRYRRLPRCCLNARGSDGISQARLLELTCSSVALKPMLYQPCSREHQVSLPASRGLCSLHRAKQEPAPSRLRADSRRPWLCTVFLHSNQPDASRFRTR